MTGSAAITPTIHLAFDAAGEAAETAAAYTRAAVEFAQVRDARGLAYAIKGAAAALATAASAAQTLQSAPQGGGAAC